MARHSFIQMSKLSNVKGRISYISDPKRQEYLYATFSTREDMTFCGTGCPQSVLVGIGRRNDAVRVSFRIRRPLCSRCPSPSPDTDSRTFHIFSLVFAPFVFCHSLSRPLQTCLFPHHRLGTPNHRECLQMLFPELFHLPDRRSPDRRYIRRAHIGTCPFRFLLI